MGAKAGVAILLRGIGDHLDCGTVEWLLKVDWTGWTVDRLWLATAPADGNKKLRACLRGCGGGEETSDGESVFEFHGCL
jgi:hypothetical protein